MAIVRRDPTKSREKKKPREDEPEEKVKLTLPTEATEPVDDLWGNLILLFGERKVGKTAMLSKVKGAFFMATEVGYKGLRLFKRDVTTWREAKGYAKLIAKDKEYKVIVIDIADILYDLCFDYICEKMVISHPNDEDYGKAWHAIKKEFENFLLNLAHSGKGVVLVSHAEEKEVKQRGGEGYDRIMPTMSKQARKIIEGMVDIWACFTYDGKRRVLVISGDDHIAAGHRFGERFLTPDGRRLRQIYMGRSPKEALANLQAAWNNEFEPHKDGDAEEVSTTKKSKISLRR